MPILLTTFGLLLIFSLIAVEQASSIKESALITQITQATFSEHRKNLENELKKMARQVYNSLRPKPERSTTQEKIPTKKREAENPGDLPNELLSEPLQDDPEDLLDGDKYDSEEPKGKDKPETRRTRYLHLQDMFTDDSTQGVASKANVCKTLFQALINELYKDKNFYEETKLQYPDLEEHFVQHIYQEGQVLKKKKKKLTNARQLKGIFFEDEALKNFRMKLFSGKEHLRETFNDKTSSHYALSEYISLKKSKDILSLWLAPPPILRALFQNDMIVDELLAFRQDTYNELRSSKNRESIKEEAAKHLRAKYGEYIPQYAPYIDFDVSTTKPTQDFAPKKEIEKK